MGNGARILVGLAAGLLVALVVWRLTGWFVFVLVPFGPLLIPRRRRDRRGHA